MIFDVAKALSTPAIRDAIGKRETVLERFGPVFRDPSNLTKQDYVDFLSVKHNHHWTGLERLGRPAADNIDTLRYALAELVDETKPLPERLDFALARISGVGVATLTPILLVAYPERYGVWNGTSEREMRASGLWPSFPRGATQGQKYEKINAVLVDLARRNDVDLWELDAFWWVAPLERQDTGDNIDAWSKAIAIMALRAGQTASQANGQLVERILKNKELRIDKEDLIPYLEQLLQGASYRCAITGLELQPNGPDDQLRPSLDRIDSDGHYEAGNLQVVARFINFWKLATPDQEFRRLLQIVRNG